MATEYQMHESDRLILLLAQEIVGGSESTGDRAMITTMVAAGLVRMIEVNIGIDRLSALEAIRGYAEILERGEAVARRDAS